MKQQIKEGIDDGVFYMTANRPEKEGIYFCQYHRNFEPACCRIFKKGKKLWLKGKTIEKPLNDVRFFAFSQRISQ